MRPCTVIFVAKCRDPRKKVRSNSNFKTVSGWFLWFGHLRHPNFRQGNLCFKWFEFWDTSMGQMSMKTIQVLSRHVASSTQARQLEAPWWGVLDFHVYTLRFLCAWVCCATYSRNEKRRRWKGRCGKPGGKNGVGLHPGCKIQRLKRILWKRDMEKGMFLSTISNRAAFDIWIWNIIFFIRGHWWECDMIGSIWCLRTFFQLWW